MFLKLINKLNGATCIVNIMLPRIITIIKNYIVFILNFISNKIKFKL